MSVILFAMTRHRKRRAARRRDANWRLNLDRLFFHSKRIHRSFSVTLKFVIEIAIPLDSQIEHLRGIRKTPNAATIAGELRAILQNAAISWRTRGAETPPTGEILLELVGLLFRHGIVRRPPPRKLDE